MGTRDQWYKPNLLYNIHYRPPKKPEPPKMIVETVQYNPSLCTCGEHGCQPQYRMEKRVLWTNRELCNEKQQSKINDREKQNEYRESKLEEIITKRNRKNGSVIESKQMGFKEENDQQIRFMIEADGNKRISAESFKERISADVEVRSGYKGYCAVKEKENVEVESDDDTDNEKMEKKEVCVYKNEVEYSGCKEDICIDKEASNINNIEENKNRKDRDNFEGRNSEGVYGEKCIGNDSESASNNDYKGDGKSSKDQIEEEQTPRGDGAVDRNCAGDDGECSSENRILINNSDEAAGSCSLESKNEGLEDVEIASEFGIMSIYCNSELHNWMSFESEDA